ncbi:hypothetical protein [Planomonospora venezuelensis]|uniref:DUF4115 domain-containing protein n=1 Tax=Planomonospora venezuelensis TaxID=1999 RepID=A0A841CYH1_PLAVE|nr:hypothetical protein [Planomonospora venezuelensis]MBB5961037.1 hypothetical protein [Planomonospora venezuelensis]GIN05364.1 hypothetical protein Pve01_70220 [Planomonospora venezuelensis]
MGIARLVLAALAGLALLSLIVFGILSLVGALDTEPAPGSSSAPAAVSSAGSAADGSAGSSESSAATPGPSAGSGPTPTVRVECVQENCPRVFLKVAGGDVLFDREMARGEVAQSAEEKVDVVLTDASAVRVQENGAARPPGGAGERQEFTVTRE